MTVAFRGDEAHGVTRFKAETPGTRAKEETIEVARKITANSIALLDKMELNSIAFPALGTGFAKFDPKEIAVIMLAGDGLHPSSKGKRVKFTKAQPKVTDGPFAETKELIAGFWMWKVKSMEEAVEWVKRCPMAEGDELEIRQVFEAEDFGEAFTPELRAQEERLLAEAQKLTRA